MSEATSIKRIAILISGRGSNMIALAEAVARGTIPNAEVAVVISDQPNAAGLQNAAELGIETLAIERRGRSRQEHDSEVVDALRQREIDLVCLAGYMRIVSSVFIDAYRGRILNIHPSLLPSFQGLNAQKQALDHGSKVSGCTVHYVDENLDLGPIIAQREVIICEDETVESLSQKILVEEHQLYPEAVNIVLGSTS